MSYVKKIVPLLLALAAIGGLAACGSSDNEEAVTGQFGSESAPTTSAQPEGEDEGSARAAVETIVVREGKPVGGVRELEYGSGEEVRFRVRSDAADEIHVHGYDLTKDVAAGGSVVFSFPADIEGIFEIELEVRGEQIAELRINP